MTENNKTQVNERISILKKEILPVLGRYGVIKAGIFGSTVRGDSKKNSDIDLLVEFEPDKSLLDLIGVKQDLEEKLKRKVDVVTYNSINPRLKKYILPCEVRIL